MPWHPGSGVSVNEICPGAPGTSQGREDLRGSPASTPVMWNPRLRARRKDGAAPAGLLCAGPR